MLKTQGLGNDKGMSAPLVSPSSQEMDGFEKDEIKKSRSLVKNKLNEWYEWLIDHIPKPIKNVASKEFLELKNCILMLYDGVKKTLNRQTEDITAHENEEGNGYIRIEVPFNSIMTECFEGSDIDDLIQRMLAYIKAQTENSKFPESGFTLDKITHLYINFHKLALTRGSSYTGLPEWIKSKKAVISPLNKDEECFKWAVIEALHHQEIKHHPDRISLLRTYKNQYYWKGLEFPVSIKKINKFEKSNPGIAGNVLF